MMDCKSLVKRTSCRPPVMPLCHIDQLQQTLSSRDRVMALDHGEKRIGIAICDRDRRLATPLKTIARKPLAHAFADIENEAKDCQIGGFIVGLPLHMNGQPGISARQARDFAVKLMHHTNLPTALVDERLSSRAVESDLKHISIERRRTVVDQLAAAWFLQGVLDRWNNHA